MGGFLLAGSLQQGKAFWPSSKCYKPSDCTGLVLLLVCLSGPQESWMKRVFPSFPSQFWGLPGPRQVAYEWMTVGNWDREARSDFSYRSRSISLFSTPLVLHVILASFADLPNVAYEKKQVRRGINMLFFGMQRAKNCSASWMRHHTIVSVMSL